MNPFSRVTIGIFYFFLILFLAIHLQPILGQEDGLYLEPDEFFGGMQNGDYDAVLDVRTNKEWMEGHIENATFVPNLASTGSPNTDLVTGCSNCTIAVYCTIGGRAQEAIRRLRNNFGFTGILYNARGVIQWTEAGYPLVPTEESTIPSCVKTNKCRGCTAIDCPTSTSSVKDSAVLRSLFASAFVALVMVFLIQL